MKAVMIGCMVLAITLDAQGDSAAGEKSAVTVPVRLSSNYPLIDIEVAGVRIPVLFDLGEDSALVLTKVALAQLKVTANGPGYKVSDPKGNTLESRTFQIPRLSIGGASFTSVSGRVDVHDPSYDSSKVGQEGYVGPSLLRDYKIVIDYQRGLITLIPNTTADSDALGCRGTEAQFLPEWKGLPVTRSITDLGAMNLIWDTGTPLSLVKDSLLKAHRAATADREFRSKHFWMNGIDFGPEEFHGFEFDHPPGIDGFIGTPFFAKHVVCVDLHGKRFFISGSLGPQVP